MADAKRKRMTVAEECELRAQVQELRRDRYILAQLADDKRPQFDNPIIAWAAMALRDRVLAEGL